MIITTEKAFKMFLLFYGRAIENKCIEKPMTWALYHTWKWADEKEKPKIDTDKMIVIDGKTYVADDPKLKTVHGKTGEVVIGGFREVEE